MDIFILLATMLVCFLIGMPIAYSLALAAIAGAWSIGIPLEAVMLKNLRRRQQGSDADDPVFRAGGRDHGGRRHGAPAGGVCRRPRGIYPGARRPFHRQRAGDDLPERHFRFSGRGYLRDRLGDDPANGKGRLSTVFATNLTNHRLGSGFAWCRRAHNAVLYSLATGGTISISALFMAGVFPGLLLGLFADHSLPGHRLPRQASPWPEPWRQRTR